MAEDEQQFWVAGHKQRHDTAWRRIFKLVASSGAPRSKTGRWEPPPQNLRYPEFSKGETERKRNEQMPAKSKAQQMAAGAALAAKRGEKKTSELKGASKSMEKSMSEKELDKMASTKRKGKPQKKS